MFGKLTNAKLTRAGFQLEKCEDGHFWVYEKEAGEEADRLLLICQRALEDFDEEAVRDVILIQCDANLTDPTLYLDGFQWNISQRDLRDIAELLFKDRQKLVQERHQAQKAARKARGEK